jgi:hypothetical protein
VSVLCADSFEPQARRYRKPGYGPGFCPVSDSGGFYIMNGHDRERGIIARVRG